MRFTIVESKNGTPLTCCDFVPPGGTIGRSVDNDLVLPDEDRAISRLQAVVHVASNGDCRLTNHGSVTAVVHNRVPLARGSQILLQHADVLNIGHYQIRVSDPAHEEETAFSDIDPLTLFTHDDNSASDPLGISRHQEAVLMETFELHTEEQLSARQARQNVARLSIDPVNHAMMPSERTTSPGNEQRLLAALMDGMGLDYHADKPTLTEDQMRITGRMLSLFSQGTVALLSSRSILKRGVKAEMTMILNEANNPFKILPSGKTVLMQIYQSEMPGFMPPEQAVRDALVDLQAHQLGMIAGIRAIIAAMLQSFNPQRLEDFARRDGNMPRISPGMMKKAALWDYFLRHYQKMSGEIEDDFHTLFGNAFLQAYDMEVNQYKDSQSRPEEE
ncbi:type VI secretion system-associated FHA domain protein TagH [Erwinia psidii]|uniref:Type VI secretion system-associated FHA domain protein TagH n=1 Tax=Erwinia psidii TaxID=69224 RepID=A0A3N6V0L3_9GAMM|nr:type VI secretion system-associated FHA domain protein TagH [Erwinia psidii]MCX8955877.1 type VI secretion system-associated FHA domain protein TagH [Erwinia psidii]MCX8961248.1 type VI secretion system-associated FHA domain protein TagH [Erwinia psidii]MCX8966425.1 type VI secretion system-associated FHA domain protein TagH [Erwinia psidii]RQM38595.1 type VI secretion system-associated FHA domain protein TagH [Erwinia psidii]